MSKRRRSLNRKKLVLIGLALVLLLAAGLYLTKIQKSQLGSANADTRKLLTGIKGDHLAESSGRGCDSGGGGGNCYQMHTTVIAIDAPGIDPANALIGNLNKEGWKTEENTTIKAVDKSDIDSLKSGRLAEGQDVSDKQAVHFYLSFLTPGLFGEQSWLKKDAKVMKINSFISESFKDRSEGDGLYILRSEVPGDSLDYKAVFIEYLQANPDKIIIALSASE